MGLKSKLAVRWTVDNWFRAADHLYFWTFTTVKETDAVELNAMWDCVLKACPKGLRQYSMSTGIEGRVRVRDIEYRVNDRKPFDGFPGAETALAWMRRQEIQMGNQLRLLHFCRNAPFPLRPAISRGDWVGPLVLVESVGWLWDLAELGCLWRSGSERPEIAGMWAGLNS